MPGALESAENKSNSKKGGTAVKDFIKKNLGIIASLAFVITTVTANSTCICLIHQDKLPDEAKKLRKF